MSVIVPIIYFVVEFILIVLAYKFVVTDKFARIASTEEDNAKNSSENIDEKSEENRVEKSEALSVSATISTDTAEEKSSEAKCESSSVDDKISELIDCEDEKAKARTNSDRKDGFLIEALRKFKVLLYDKKYSMIFGALLFSLIVAVCGVFVVDHTENMAKVLQINPIMIYVKLFLIFAGLSISFLTDVRYHLIFNKIVLIMLGIRLILFIPEYFMMPERFFSTLTTSCIGGAITFVIFVLFSLLSKGAIGMGDVKLFAVFSFIADFYCSINILLYSSLVCMFFFVVLIIVRSKKVKDKIPFAPFIFIGFVITLILGAF